MNEYLETPLRNKNEIKKIVNLENEYNSVKNCYRFGSFSKRQRNGECIYRLTKELCDSCCVLSCSGS
jgi:hypothetical protein